MKLGQIVKAAAVIIKNLILGCNLISLSLLTKPRIMIGYISENLFLYKTYSSNRGILQKSVYKVLPANNVENINLGNLNFGGTYFSSGSSYAIDIVSLCLICQIIKPKLVFEIGTMKGYTAFHFALNTPNNSQIYTLDMPKNLNSNSILKTTILDDAHIKSYIESNKYDFENSDVASKITCLFGDSATFNFSPFHGKVDFFFIDGAHSYEYVRSDTLNALRCCHPGSVIAWHDFGRIGVNGVSKWILEFSKNHEVYAVPGGSLVFMVAK